MLGYAAWMWTWLLACTGAPSTPSDSKSPDPDSGPIAEAPGCPIVTAGVDVGTVDQPDLIEASGLVVTDAHLWLHNDSGDPVLFALDHTGAHVARLPLLTTTGDWEGATWRRDRLWIGDIGDNNAVRPDILLLEVELPDPVADGAAAVPRPLRLTWPEGPVDSETLMADPITDDLLLVTKVFDGDVGIYRVLDPEAEASDLERVASLQFGEGALAPTTLVTGGEIAPDGRLVILRTYLDAFAWPRIPGEPWADTFAREPCPIDLETEAQGETLGFGPDALWTISEGEAPTVWRYGITTER